VTSSTHRPSWLDPNLTVGARVDAVMKTLSQDARAAIALGEAAPLRDRGLPTLSYVDAGTGLRDVESATAFPCGVSLAASFEARAAGFSVLLGPTLDLARDPRGGRLAEAFGEDPYLAGLIGSAHVRGAQSNAIITQVKHFVAYNSEERRTGYGLPDQRGRAMDVTVDEATLHDLYLRPFEAAVAAGAWSMMGSYNRINGQYACQSADILGIPRRLWGWRGFYCPDAVFAVRDDDKALRAGLDLGALGGAGGRTHELLRDIDPSYVEAAVRNVITALIGSGLADAPLGEPAAPSSREHQDLAASAAIAGSVLLRNAGTVLPLANGTTSIALIGPSGEDAMFVTGGAAAVGLDWARVVTPAAGLIARAGSRISVALAQGTYGDHPLPVVPADAFTLPDGSGQGVLVDVIDSKGDVREVQVASIDMAIPYEDLSEALPVRWRTQLTSSRSGVHRLSLELGGRARVSIDGHTVMVGSRELEQFFGGPHLPLQCCVELVGGEPVRLEIEYEIGPAIVIPPAGKGPTLRLGWQPPDLLMDEAVAAAAASDVAVVVVQQASGEGMDRDSLRLPGDQDELVRRVAAANPRTIVVLNTAGAVEMPWLEDVAAVLQVWYPGEGFGTALAAMLLGDAEPGGRLPITFPRERAHLPGGESGPEQTPEELDYSERLGIGYRSPAILESGAMFPFGHGLSYSATHSSIVRAEIRNGALVLTIEARNLSARPTVHVAQVYAELFAVEARELVAVARIELEGAASRCCEVSMPAGAFHRWDPSAKRRQPVDGEHRVTVSTSSTGPGHVINVSLAQGTVASIRSLLIN
jgi:beta-glucosidase